MVEKCPMCLQTEHAFRDKKTFQKHVQDHTRPWERCGQCGKNFSNKYVVRKHQKYCDNYNKIPCWEPGCKALVTPKAMADHREVFHGDGKTSHQCYMCGKNYACKKRLQKHLLTHNPNRPVFPCGLCTKVYQTKDSIRRHMKEEHP